MTKRITIIAPLAGLLCCSGCSIDAGLSTTSLGQSLATFVQDFILHALAALAL